MARHLQIPAVAVAARIGAGTVLASGTALAGLCYCLAGLSSGFASSADPPMQVINGTVSSAKFYNAAQRVNGPKLLRSKFPRGTTFQPR
jgi:hypothetical protein